MPLRAQLLLSAAVASFTLAFWWLTTPGIVERRPRTVIVVLGWTALVATFINTDLSYVFAMTLPVIYPWRRALWWVTCWTLPSLVWLAYYVAVLQAPELSAPMVAFQLLVHVVWRGAMFAIGLTIAMERDARALVADRTRLAERLEISRELHDSLGHHLAALNVQLELARHQVTGEAREAIAQAQATGRQLLVELRGVVSAWRDDTLDLRSALHALARTIDTPAIEVRITDTLVFPPEIARTLYRCAQELVTNAVRHANAAHVWIDVAAREGGIALAVRDDGTAPPELIVGNGLRGLAERVAELDGRVDVRAEGSVRVEVWLPTRKAAA